MTILENLEDIWINVRETNDYAKSLVTLATSIGALVIFFYFFKLIYKLTIGFRLYCLSQWTCIYQPNLVEKYGQWAVISGATDGIGLAMAHELSRRGMSLLIIGRNEEKLANTKSALETNMGQVVTVKIDLSDSSLDNFAKIRQLIDPDNRDIGILINNAGTFPDKFQRFNNFSQEHLTGIVNLNILAVVHLTRMIMPGMIARGKGCVMNVSSQLGSIPAPYMSIYGATKSFVDAFSRQLQLEYSSHPIDIRNLTAGAVHTKLLRATVTLSRPTLANPTPEDYARSALNGLSAGIYEYSGTAFHGLGRRMAELFSALGLTTFLFNLHVRFNARNYHLSPVPKRKNLSKVVTLELPTNGDVTST